MSFPSAILRRSEKIDVWKRQAQSYIVIKGCWMAYVHDATDADLNARAFSEIPLMVEPDNLGHIGIATTAKDAWSAL